MDKLENATGNYIPQDDDDQPDLGIWDPRYNVEKVKKPFPRARSTLKFLASMKKNPIKPKNPFTSRDKPNPSSIINVINDYSDNNSYSRKVSKQVS